MARVGEKKKSTLVHGLLTIVSTLIVGGLVWFFGNFKRPPVIFDTLTSHFILATFFLVLVISSSVWKNHQDDIIVPFILLSYMCLLTFLMVWKKLKGHTLHDIGKPNFWASIHKYILVGYGLYTLIFMGVFGWGIHTHTYNKPDASQWAQYQRTWRVLAIIFTSTIWVIAGIGFLFTLKKNYNTCNNFIIRCRPTSTVWTLDTIPKSTNRAVPFMFLLPKLTKNWNSPDKKQKPAPHPKIIKLKR